MARPATRRPMRPEESRRTSVAPEMDRRWLFRLSGRYSECLVNRSYAWQGTNSPRSVILSKRSLITRDNRL